MMPGMGNIQVGNKEEKALARHEAIILSMTKEERRLPRLIAGSRRKRIADGSGVQIRDVNRSFNFPDAENDEKNERWENETNDEYARRRRRYADLGDMNPKELAKLAKQFK